MTIRRVVGSAEDCDLRIKGDEYVSNHHFALIQEDDGTVFVDDLGSMNGTRVRDPMFGWTRVITPAPIGAGSKIHAGRTLFELDGAGRVSVEQGVSPLDLR